MKGRVLQLDLSLDDVGTSSEDTSMLGSMVAEAMSQAAEVLQQTIHPLMPCSSYSFHALISILVTSRGDTPAMAITVGAISKKEFVRCKCITQSISADW